MSKKNKITRQGVRDLNSLPSKSRGIRLEPIPSQEENFSNDCDHPDNDLVQLRDNSVRCRKCNKTVR